MSKNSESMNDLTDDLIMEVIEDLKARIKTGKKKKPVQPVEDPDDSYTANYSEDYEFKIVPDHDDGGDDESISNPSHYKGHGEIDCKTAMQAMVGGQGMEIFWRLAALKYLWRYDRKNGNADINKAIQCLYNLKQQYLTNKR